MNETLENHSKKEGNEKVFEAGSNGNLAKTLEIEVSVEKYEKKELPAIVNGKDIKEEPPIIELNTQNVQSINQNLPKPNPIKKPIHKSSLSFMRKRGRKKKTIGNKKTQEGGTNNQSLATSLNKIFKKSSNSSMKKTFIAKKISSTIEKAFQIPNLFENVYKNLIIKETMMETQNPIIENEKPPISNEKEIVLLAENQPLYSNLK